MWLAFLVCMPADVVPTDRPAERPARAIQLRPGDRTFLASAVGRSAEDVIRRFGHPAAVTKKPNGEVEWVYRRDDGWEVWLTFRRGTVAAAVPGMRQEGIGLAFEW